MIGLTGPVAGSDWLPLIVARKFDWHKLAPQLPIDNGSRLGMKAFICHNGQTKLKKKFTNHLMRRRECVFEITVSRLTH